MRVLGKLVRAARTAAMAPPFVGALVVLGLAAGAGRPRAGDDAELGDLRRVVAGGSVVEHRFAPGATWMTVALLAAAIALGLFVGLVAGVLIRARHGPPRTARTVRLGTTRRLLETTLVCLAVHALLVLWAMADSPQLYSARWYAVGGLARLIQVLATDVLGPRGVVFLSIAAAAVYARPTRLMRLAHHAVARVKRSLRQIAPRAATRLAAPSVALGIAAAALASSHRMAAPSRARATPPAPRDSGGASPGVARRPNIVILAVDSMRADRLDARVAPHLARLAARGTRFDRAYVSLPRTLPSWVTLLTGRHSHHHGIRSTFPTWEERGRDFDALPARLARAGYATAVVGDRAGEIFGRIDLGFGRVDVPAFDFGQRSQQHALERETPLLPVLHSPPGRRLFPAMRALRGAADPVLLADDARAAIHAMRDTPFLLTVSFSTARAPYAAPAPYYAKYTDPGYRGRFKYHGPLGLGGGPPPDAADIRQLRALYDGAVSAVDDAAESVLLALESEGLADDTIVVVTAGHGETLDEHGHGLGHGDHLFGDEGVHVPLVVFDPRAARSGASGEERRASAIARDVDLAPTLYELAGVPAPTDLDGRSLVPALEGRPIEPRLAYAETEPWSTEAIPGLAPALRIPYPGVVALAELDARHDAETVLRREMLPLTAMARHRMIRDERFKLVYAPTRKGVVYILFDTLADPGETRDVAAAHPEVVAALRAELWAWMLRDPQMEQRDGFLVPRDPARMASAPSIGPYNVLWIVVDTLRADVRACFRDDAEDRRQLAAPSPPLDARLPEVPGLTPAIDDLARRGVRFTRAYSAGAWTRPGALAMLSGARSSELGFDAESGALLQAQVARFLASDPPLLPLIARRHGASTHAFGNNVVMLGDALGGVEMGFEHAVDPRIGTRDALEIARDATAWIHSHSDTRFFLFVSYRSPHEPNEPSSHTLERVPPAPAGPADRATRRCVAEAAKVDGAIGVLVRSIADVGLRDRTIVVVTGEHGEILSSARQRVSALDRTPRGDPRAARNSVEATHVPVVLVAPGLLPEGRAVPARVRSVDVAPTIAELLGLEVDTRFSGRSLVGLARGETEKDERVVVTEGRETRAILHGRYRLLVREGPARATTIGGPTLRADEQLFDLVDDPGELRDLAKALPDVVAELRARLVAALAQEPVAGSSAATSLPGNATLPTIRLRFVGGGKARRVSGSIRIGDARTTARSFTVEPVELGRDALKTLGDKVEIALSTSPVSAVGFDIVVEPATTPVTWDLYLDDQVWPEGAVFGGPYGLLAPALRSGIQSFETRLAAQASLLPPIDARREVGVFVVRERGERGSNGTNP